MTTFTCWPWLYWARHRPNETAIIIEQQPITWLQLACKIQDITEQLVQQGVTAGQGIVLRGKNSETLLLSYLAGMQLGCRILPLNPQLPDTLLTKLLPSLPVHFGWNEQPYCWPQQIKHLTIHIEQDSYKRLSQDVNLTWQPKHPLTMTLTSGSTGLPKAIIHNAHNHLMNAAGLLQCMRFGQQDSWLLSLPLFHVSGQGIVWRWLYRGATIVLHNMSLLTDALSTCSHASLVPTQLWRLLSQTDNKIKLKQVLLGGATIPVELVQKAQQAGINCWCGYGMTEMASTICAKEANTLPGVGIPLPFRQLRLVDEEILVSGDCLAMGYWQNNTIIPLTDAHGWFHTHDRGVMRNGELCIIGRLDNIFYSGGEAIQPEDIEKVLLAHPYIEQAFVLPLDDAEFGQRPVAVLQCISTITHEEIAKWLEGKIARYQYPVACYRLPEKLNQNGIKVSRKALSQWLTDVVTDKDNYSKLA